MWPAIVEEVIGFNRFVVHFFGDYSKSTVYRSSLLHNFVDGFVVYNSNEKMSKNSKLCKSVKEAAMHFKGLERSSPLLSCVICEFLNTS